MWLGVAGASETVLACDGDGVGGAEELSRGGPSETERRDPLTAPAVTTCVNHGARQTFYF